MQSGPLYAMRTFPGSLPAGCHRQSMRPAYVHVRARAGHLAERFFVFTSSVMQSFGRFLYRRIVASIL